MFTGDGFSPFFWIQKLVVFTVDVFSLKSGFMELLCTPENPLQQLTVKDLIAKYFLDYLLPVIPGVDGAVLQAPLLLIN